MSDAQKELENKITIGGQVIVIPELNLKALKKMFPLIKKMRVISPEELAQDDGSLSMEALDNTVAVLEIALVRSKSPMTADQIEEALTVSEIPGLQPALLKILEMNGLKVQAPKSGELEAAAVVEPEAATSSTATSTRSSAKSFAASEA